MELVNDKIRLGDLAKALNVTNQSLRNHLKNNSGLGQGAEKDKGSLTGDWLLSIDSVINYINWSFSHRKQVDVEALTTVQKELEWLKHKPSKG